MTKPDLDYLVRLARRDRPPSALLDGVARRLRVPFVVAPVAAVVLPSSAFAAAMAKLSLSRGGLFGWGAGCTLAVASGVVALTPTAAPTSPVNAPAVLQAAVSARLAEAAPSSLPESEPQAAPTPSLSERPKPPGAPSPWNEPQLIERARKALGTDPKRALALTQEYQRRFPGGALAVEREVIALEALARLGQRAEARRRALAFEAQHPSSIHLPRVRALLAKLNRP